MIGENLNISVIRLHLYCLVVSLLFFLIKSLLKKDGDLINNLKMLLPISLFSIIIFKIDSLNFVSSFNMMDIANLKELAQWDLQLLYGIKFMMILIQILSYLIFLVLVITSPISYFFNKINLGFNSSILIAVIFVIRFVNRLFMFMLETSLTNNVSLILLILIYAAYLTSIGIAQYKREKLKIVIINYSNAITLQLSKLGFNLVWGIWDIESIILNWFTTSIGIIYIFWEGIEMFVATDKNIWLWKLKKLIEHKDPIVREKIKQAQAQEQNNITYP